MYMHRTTGSRRPNHILFFAAIPPPSIAERVENAWRIAGTRDRFRARTLHMTILPVGGVDDVEPGLVHSLAWLFAGFRFPAFDITLDRLMSWSSGKRRPIVLGKQGESVEVNNLARRLGREVQRLSPTFRFRNKVTPHVTCAYGAGFAGERLLPDTIRWPVRELVLIDSVQGYGLHIPLARWPLRPC